MKRTGSSLAVVFALLLAIPAFGVDWQAKVGAQSQDKGHQALAFLPNEIWIHVGDSITWTFAVDEIHTVTFMPVGQVRLPFAVGCPGFSGPSASFDGTTCITAPPSTVGQTFTVMFSAVGNFKLTCLVHEDMTGVVHVLDTSAPLPHDQAFYDKEGAKQAQDLLSAPDLAAGQHHHDDDRAAHSIAVGVGKVVGNGGGHETVSIMRFVEPELIIHTNQTVEWTNHDSVTPHTITFGPAPDPVNPIPPSANVTVDADGARHAMISSPSQNVHSGFIRSAPQERIGLPTTPPGTTQFRVTFTAPGVYNYRCALHDDLGMVGRIVVLP
jgi:plastocyanin